MREQSSHPAAPLAHRTAGKGDSVIRYLLAVISLASLACGIALAIADDRPSAREVAKPTTMRFDWRTEGPADACAPHCRVWISATGVITESTARDFETFAKDGDVRGATLVLDSEGGSVLAAMALGRAIRKLDMTTTVGKTMLLGAGEDGKSRASLVTKASCESMCAFILLGGVRRYVPPEARVLVHQIWLGSKSRRALEASYTAEELGLVQRDVGSLARYTVEMGGGIELLETALRVPPWEPMHALTREELYRMKVMTVDNLFEPEVATAPPTLAPTPASVTSTLAQHGPN
jgi:hypothetical protein